MILGILASFFLFVSFILELFVMIGQLSNKSLLNVLYLVQVNNRQYNLSYNFALWSYCQGPYLGPVQSCSKNTAAYNWATTPGFSTMLPTLASSQNIQSIFLALFILYFIGLILSLLLWLTTLLALRCTIVVQHKKRRRRRLFDLVMGLLTLLNVLILFVVMILAITLVIHSVKAVSAASLFWSGHAGISLWLTIASVIALCLATTCYLFQFCSSCRVDREGGDGSRGNDKSSSRGARVDPIGDGYKKPFDLTPHQAITHTPMLHHAITPLQLLEQ